MRTQLTAAVLLAGILTACSTDTAIAPTVEPLVSSADAAGVARPNTLLSAQVIVQVGGAVVYRESGAGNNGKGYCTTGGAWYNPESRKTSGKAHPQCANATGGQPIVVNFAETANYVVSPSGNVQLNVAADPACLATSLDASACGRGIHYRKAQNATAGFGLVTATEASSGAWTIDLAAAMQPFNGPDNNVVRTGMVVVACNATHGCHPGTMSW
jgi:hypothetical protein